MQESVKESPFYLLYGRDPRLPTTLDMDNNAKQEIDVDTYKGEMAIKFDEACDLAQNNIKRAQRHQKAYYDTNNQSHPDLKSEIEYLCTCSQLRQQRTISLLDPFMAPIEFYSKVILK